MKSSLAFALAFAYGLAAAYGTYAAYHYTKVAVLQAHFMEECNKEVTERGGQTPQQALFFCYRAIYSGK